MPEPGPFADREKGSGKKRLAARARWEREIGWSYLKAIQDAGRKIDAADLPPELEWEAPVWDELYKRVRTQWRWVSGMKAERVGLDYGPAIAVIGALGWDLLEALDLLREIEMEMLTADADG